MDMLDNDCIIVAEKEFIGYDAFAKECKVVVPYSHFQKNRFLRLFRRKFLRFLNLERLCMNKELLTSKPKFVIFLDTIDPKIVSLYRDKNADGRIAVYYVNPAKYSTSPLVFKKLNCEMWTFDEKDAATFEMKWAPLSYYGCSKYNGERIENDVWFVGSDKGRYETLIKYKNTFQQLGLKCLFWITPNNNSIFYSRIKYSKKIPYSENIGNILKSKSVLDIMQEEQTGFTMRVPECMVNHKKLITNNKKIKEYPFYCRNNIFILGEDNLDRLNDFVNSTWDSSKDDFVSCLEIKEWIKALKDNHE